MLTEDRFVIVRHISNHVFFARDTRNDEVVVVKKIRVDVDVEDGLSQKTIREVSALKDLTHPNVVSLREVAVLPDSKLIMVFEKMDQNLDDFIKSTKTLELHVVRDFMFQLLTAIDFCHSSGVIHRNLKPANVLLSSDHKRLKICGFSLSRQYTFPMPAYSRDVVSLPYRCPELLIQLSKKYTTAIDIWSVGCIFAEMVTKRLLFDGGSEIGQLTEIFRTLGTPNETLQGLSALEMKIQDLPQSPPVPLETLVPGLDQDGHDLLKKMLDFDPNTRITAKSALRHKYFAKMRA